MKIIPVIKTTTVENNLKKITIKNASKIIIGEIKYQLNYIWCNKNDFKTQWSSFFMKQNCSNWKKSLPELCELVESCE